MPFAIDSIGQQTAAQTASAELLSLGFALRELEPAKYQSGGNKLRIAGARCGIISLVSPPHQGVSYYL